MFNKYLFAGAAGVLVIVAGAGSGLAQRDLTVLQLRPNFYMIAGAGANIGVQVGSNGAVVVDSGSGANVQAVIAAVKKIGPYPIRYLINTSADADHVGGNEQLARAGETL